jgi:hypothetical protein
MFFFMAYDQRLGVILCSSVYDTGLFTTLEPPRICRFPLVYHVIYLAVTASHAGVQELSNPLLR